MEGHYLRLDCIILYDIIWATIVTHVDEKMGDYINFTTYYTIQQLHTSNKVIYSYHRAFERNKLDLTEVEGLADLIHAETEAQRRQALRQMEGALSQLYTEWRTRLLKVTQHITGAIYRVEDSSTEGNSAYYWSYTEWRTRLLKVTQHITGAIQSGELDYLR